MSKYIDLAELDSIIDRDIDFECYELTVPASAFSTDNVYHFDVYEGGLLRTSASVFDGNLLLSPDLVKVAENKHLLAVGIRNDVINPEGGVQSRDIVVSLYSASNCFISLGDERFLPRSIDEVARLIINGNGPRYRITVANDNMFDISFHKCEIELTNDELGIGVSYIDADGIDKLVRHLKTRA